MTLEKEQIQHRKHFVQQRLKHINDTDTDEWFIGFVQQVETWQEQQIDQRMRNSLIQCWQQGKLGTFFQQKDLEEAQMKDKIFQAKDNIKSFSYFCNVFEINMCRMLLYMHTSPFALDPKICQFIQSLNACRVLMQDYIDLKHVQVLKVKFFGF